MDQLASDIKVDLGGIVQIGEGVELQYEPSDRYHILKWIDGKQFRLFKSMSGIRLKEETTFEYRMRRKYINDTIKKHKKQGYKN